MAADHRPWTALDPAIADVLRPALAPVAEAVLQEIAGQPPALGGGLADELGDTLRLGIEPALGRLLDLFGTEEPALDPRLVELYESFGKQESRRGRPLDALLAAYRTGARVAWGLFSEAAVQAGVETRQLVLLAEVIFVYIDELSAASATGHAREHAVQTGYRDVLRSRLAAALIEGQAATSAARLHRLADDVGWPIPARLAVAVLPTPPGRPESGGYRLPIAPPDVLVLAQDGEVLAIVPDPSGPGRRVRLATGLGPDAEVYVGTVRPPEETPVSLAHARAVHRLVLDGVLTRAPLVAAADHLPELVLHADPRLLSDLTSRAFAPLVALAPRRRETLLSTLRGWLAHQGDRSAVAAELGVHPQTVSYRMARLDELFGGSLDDPRRRLALVLALESRGPGPARPSSVGAAAPS